MRPRPAPGRANASTMSAPAARGSVPALARRGMTDVIPAYTSGIPDAFASRATAARNDARTVALAPLLTIL